MFILSLIGSYSIALAVLIGLIRYKKIHVSFRPFIFICCLSLLNELVSLALIYTIGNTNVTFNIYGLIESVLYMWLFKNWGHFTKWKFSYGLLIALLAAVWVTDNFILHSLKQDNYIFWIFYSFTLIFLSIDEVNIIVMTNRGKLLRDSRFLICMGLLIFYTYWVILQVFYLFKLTFSKSFSANVYMVLEVVNFLINVVFALAVLWAPKRLKFILPF